MHVAVTGAAGVIGQILLEGLPPEWKKTCLDIQARQGAQSSDVRWIRGSVTESENLRDAFSGVDAVVHLATGGHGWSGLLSVEIDGTRNVFEAARACGVDRVVLASSNHAVGGVERERFAGRREPPSETDTVAVRPDSPYGAAKAFGEAYGRFAAEVHGIGVSCLRIGTMRSIDDPEAYVDDESFAHIPGGREAVRERLRATWLYHEDLISIVREELEAEERFRIRFAISESEVRFWPIEVATWDPAS